MTDTTPPGNLFDRLPPLDHPDEQVAELLAVPGLRIERIVSTGQSGPPGFWYDQAEAEWVVLLEGGAGLALEGEPEVRVMRPGDWIYLPPHRRHRVEWTAAGVRTIWVAVFHRR